MNRLISFSLITLITIGSLYGAELDKGNVSSSHGFEHGTLRRPTTPREAHGASLDALDAPRPGVPEHGAPLSLLPHVTLYRK